MRKQRVSFFDRALTINPADEIALQSADRWRDVVQWTDDQLAKIHPRRPGRHPDRPVRPHKGQPAARLCAKARADPGQRVGAWQRHRHARDGLSVHRSRERPPKVCDLFAEKICHLPCSIIIEPPPLELRAAEPPMIANGYVTDGAFTRTSRLSAAAIELWARILRADITSRLIIKDRVGKTARRINYSQRIQEKLSKEYWVFSRTLDCSKFGVPQQLTDSS